MRSGRPFLHLLTTVVRRAGPGGAHSVIAEFVLLKHQLQILNRFHQWQANLRILDVRELKTVPTCRSPIPSLNG